MKIFTVIGVFQGDELQPIIAHVEEVTVHDAIYRAAAIFLERAPMYPDVSIVAVFEGRYEDLLSMPVTRTA